MKQFILAAALMLAPAIASADAYLPFPEEEPITKADLVATAGATTSILAGLASWAAPTAVLHSSGAAILYSGTGYVAGTMGLAAGTIALLPAIALGGTLAAATAMAYKHSDKIVELYEEVTQ